jgi:hypothetical protein
MNRQIAEVGRTLEPPPVAIRPNYQARDTQLPEHLADAHRFIFDAKRHDWGGLPTLEWAARPSNGTVSRVLSVANHRLGVHPAGARG